MRMYCIGRPINGIGINGLEYAVDANGELLRFDGKDDAKTFLIEHGVDEDNLDYFEFEEVWNGMD